MLPRETGHDPEDAGQAAADQGLPGMPCRISAEKESLWSAFLARSVIRPRALSSLSE